MILVDRAEDKRSLVFCDWRRAEPTKAPAKLLSSPWIRADSSSSTPCRNNPFKPLLVSRKLSQRGNPHYLGHNPVMEFSQDFLPSYPHQYSPLIFGTILGTGRASAYESLCRTKSVAIKFWRMRFKKCKIRNS